MSEKNKITAIIDTREKLPLDLSAHGIETTIWFSFGVLMCLVLIARKYPKKSPMIISIGEKVLVHVDNGVIVHKPDWMTHETAFNIEKHFNKKCRLNRMNEIEAGSW